MQQNILGGYAFGSPLLISCFKNQNDTEPASNEHSGTAIGIVQHLNSEKFSFLVCLFFSKLEFTRYKKVQLYHIYFVYTEHWDLKKKKKGHQQGFPHIG